MLLSKKSGQIYDKWLYFIQNTFIVIKPNANIKQLNAKINKIFMTDAASEAREMADNLGMKDKFTYSLQPLLAMHTDIDYPVANGLVDTSNPTYSYMLTGIALFILAIACINFVNLTVARSLKRAKEVGIRKVAGGQRRQLIIQFLGESFILTFIAFLLAIVLVEMALPTGCTFGSTSAIASSACRIAAPMAVPGLTLRLSRAWFRAPRFTGVKPRAKPSSSVYRASSIRATWCSTMRARKACGLSLRVRRWPGRWPGRSLRLYPTR